MEIDRFMEVNKDLIKPESVNSEIVSSNVTIGIERDSTEDGKEELIKKLKEKDKLIEELKKRTMIFIKNK